MHPMNTSEIGEPSFPYGVPKQNAPFNTVSPLLKKKTSMGNVFPSATFIKSVTPASCKDKYANVMLQAHM